MTYKLGALAFRYLTGIDCDFTFGPTILSQRAVEYYLDYKSQHGDLWDSIHCPKIRIIHDGLPWTSIPINYQHPKEQTQAETGMDLFLKRIQQVDQLIHAFTDEINSLGMKIN